MSNCSSHAHATPSEPLPKISVNQVEISEELLANELQYHPHQDFQEVIRQAGQALVIQQLLMQQANQEGIETSNESEEAIVQQLLEKNVSYDDPAEEDCQRYYENNQTKFTTAPLLEADHILLAAAKEDLPAREVAKNNAKDIIAKLKQDPMLFPTLASQYSACPSKETGGSLGQISKGQTVPEFERQIMLLPEGLADSPIESRYGFHVVKIARKIEGKLLDYSMVADKVRGYLTHRASHLAIQTYIQSLVDKAEIEGIEVKIGDENVHID